MSISPVPTPPQKSNLLLWLLGLAGAAIVVVIVGGLVVTGYIVRGVRVDRSGSGVQVRTPVGPITVSKGQTRDAGLPVYPGATPVEPGKNVDISLFEEAQVGVAAAKYHSPDPPEKVDTWYREHLGPEFEREGPGGKPAKIHGKDVDIKRDDIAFVSDKGDFVRVVVISRRDPGVQITLLRVGAQEPQ